SETNNTAIQGNLLPTTKLVGDPFNMILYENYIPSEKLINIYGILNYRHESNQKFNQTLSYSSPFNGFTPNLNSKIAKISWGPFFGDGDQRNVEVITIDYKSESNLSIYRFSFEKKSGWLMEARLIKDSSSWVPDFNYMDELNIKRLFLKKSLIEEPASYKQRTLISQIIVITISILISFIIIVRRRIKPK
ncbi:MAG: hypothetical protein ACXAC7_20455, partial [Candidatus Hodarchaeales archaeon]